MADTKTKAKARFALVLLLITLISGAAYYAVSAPRHVGTANATVGVLDLTGADFGNLLYPLNGEWEFYPAKLYSPEDFSSGRVGGAENGLKFADLPTDFESLGYSVPTYGTFRLTLMTGDSSGLCCLSRKSQRRALFG